MRIALLTIATNKYDRFVNPLYESAVSLFLPNHDLDFILFTDDPNSEDIRLCRQFRAEIT